MKERIQIDGVWYVREQDDTKEEPMEIYPTHYVGVVAENSEYSFEATKIFRDDNITLYPGVGIQFKDKNNETEDYWDNDEWFLNILKNDRDALNMAREVMDESGLKFFKAFIQHLNEEGWF
jgi:hypothetical protein